MNAILMLWFATATATAQSRDFGSVTEEIEDGTIDWTVYRLEITSGSNRTVGAWHSWQGQEQEVVEILQERFPIAAEDVRIQPGISAGSIMNDSSELGLRTERDATKWHIEETRYHTSGGVEIDAYLDLRVWLGPTLRDVAIDRPVALPEEGHTGVVIDARSVAFRPAFSPTINLSSGQNLTRADRVSLETIEESSPVLYVTDPADPRALERAGPNPVFGLAHDGARGTLQLAATEWEGTAVLDALAANGRIVVVMESVPGSQ
jgi:hypothetical protein